MNFIITLVYFVIILGIIVFIHELGHFLFAKKFGVHCYEFSIGMGPKIKSFRRKNDETVYSIRAFPIGGYVSMAGESVEPDLDVPKEKNMQSKKWHQRVLIVIAGVLMNFILAFVLLIIVGLFINSPISTTTIKSVEENYPASLIGLKSGDEIIAINGKKTNSLEMLTLELQVNMGKAITVTVLDNGIKKDAFLTPKKEVIDGKETYKYGFSFETETNTGLFSAIKYSFTKIINTIIQMFWVIVYLFMGVLNLNTLAGPIGIFGVVGDSASQGFINVIYLLAFLSINVGFLNILPIPAFDGGRLLFLIIEKIKGSPINPKIENTIHNIFFVLLMVLIVVICYNDILRLG